jgi:hypothetical protein
MRRGEGAEEGSLAVVAGNPEAEEGSPPAAGTPGAAEDNPSAAGNQVEADNQVVADNRAVVDSRVEEDTPRVEEDTPAAVGIQVVEDNRVVAGSLAAADSLAAEDNRVAEGTPAAEADSSRPAAASRRRSYHTWRKRCCPGPPGSGNWGRPSAAACRTRCNISDRGRYWRRTWGILSIAAFHLSVSSITIFKGNAIPMVYV